MAAAVDAREISGLKDERVRASKELSGPSPKRFGGDVRQFVKDVKDALYCSKICSYAQGMASSPPPTGPVPKGQGQGPCRLRLRDEPAGDPDDLAGGLHHPRGLSSRRSTARSRTARSWPNLLIHPRFKEMIASRQDAWRRVVSLAVSSGRRHAGVQLLAGVLRQLPPRAHAGQPDPGAARLLWRPTPTSATTRPACSSTPSGAHDQPAHEPAKAPTAPTRWGRRPPQGRLAGPPHTPSPSGEGGVRGALAYSAFNSERPLT
jgi:hypothetical protein